MDLSCGIVKSCFKDFEVSTEILKVVNSVSKDPASPGVEKESNREQISLRV